MLKKKKLTVAWYIPTFRQQLVNFTLRPLGPNKCYLPGNNTEYQLLLAFVVPQTIQSWNIKWGPNIIQWPTNLYIWWLVSTGHRPPLNQKCKLIWGEMAITSNWKKLQYSAHKWGIILSWVWSFSLWWEVN